MSYKHITMDERIYIEVYSKLGYSARKISNILGRHHSTISRELKRVPSEEYSFKIANNQRTATKLKSINKGKYTEAIAKIIEDKLNLTWSPEQIEEAILKGKISFKTIYRWIYLGKIKTGTKVLRQKGKKRKSKEKRGKFICGVNISKRPKEVKQRDIFGHWELDTMVSSRGKSKGCLATFVERKSRLYTAIKMPDRTADSMKKAIQYLLEELPLGTIKSCTTDRGKEFGCYKDLMEENDLPLYFADAYCAWQRGSNENSNGLLREFYPKKTDLLKISQKELTQNLFLINSRPRKCLGWKTPIEIFLHEVSHLT